MSEVVVFSAPAVLTSGIAETTSISPFEGFVHGIIEKVDKFSHSNSEMFRGRKISPSYKASGKNREPYFDLAGPGRMFRSMDKMNAMRRIRQKLPAGFRRFQYSAPPFYSEKNVDGASPCDHFRQGFGLMCAEIVRDEYPSRFGISVSCLPDMPDIIILGSCRTDCRCDDLPRGDFEIDDQAERAVRSYLYSTRSGFPPASAGCVA